MNMLGGHKVTASHLPILTDLQGPQGQSKVTSEPTHAKPGAGRHQRCPLCMEPASGPTSALLTVEEPRD